MGRLWVGGLKDLNSKATIKVNFKINDKSIRSVIHWMFVQYFKAFLMSIR